MTTTDFVELMGIILAFIATNIGHLVSARNNSNKLYEAIKEQSTAADAAIDKAMSVYAAKTDAKIDELTRRLDKHNNVIERTYKLEEATAVQKEQIETITRRMGELEKAAKA